MLCAPDILHPAAAPTLIKQSLSHQHARALSDAILSTTQKLTHCQLLASKKQLWTLQSGSVFDGVQAS